MAGDVVVLAKILFSKAAGFDEVLQLSSANFVLGASATADAWSHSLCLTGRPIFSHRLLFIHCSALLGLPFHVQQQDNNLLPCVPTSVRGCPQRCCLL